MFYYLKEGKLEGIILIHVDDYLTAGTHFFKEEVVDCLRQKYVFGKVSKRDFTFTGIHIFQNDKMEIFLDHRKYINNLPMFDYENKSPDCSLDKMENKKV